MEQTKCLLHHTLERYVWFWWNLANMFNTGQDPSFWERSTANWTSSRSESEGVSKHTRRRQSKPYWFTSSRRSPIDRRGLLCMDTAWRANTFAWRFQKTNSGSTAPLTLWSPAPIFIRTRRKPRTSSSSLETGWAYPLTQRHAYTKASWTVRMGRRTRWTSRSSRTPVCQR